MIHQHNDDLIDVNAPATAETIIHALSQFHPEDVLDHQGGYGHDDDHDLTLINLQDRLTSGTDNGMGDEETLGGMSRQELENEVIRLRGLVQPQPGDHSADDTRLVPAPSRKRQKRSTSTARVEPRAREMQAGTGKRVERDRKTELYKAIRHRMRSVMGINESDPLPPPGPRLPANPLEGGPAIEVPDWNLPQSEAVAEWIETISSGLHQDLISDQNPFPKVDEEDKDHSIIVEAARVTFANFVKRYKSENDTTHAERKAKYAKKRRRWARKDLKQERRAKARASLDPPHTLAGLDQEALLFDYQSSEYSSAGEDSPDDDTTYHEQKVAGRAKAWTDMRLGPSGPPVPEGVGHNEEEGHTETSREKREGYGWASGLGRKVLEVRTPSWRSTKMNEIYAELDSISTQQSQTRSAPKISSRSTSIPSTSVSGIKSGHVAPSHHRFTLPVELRRKGSMPRPVAQTQRGKRKTIPTSTPGSQTPGSGIENTAVPAPAVDGDENRGWMWASGTVGEWPARQNDGVAT